MADPTEKKAHTWARNDLDWYVDPERCTTQLLAVERFVGEVWDPCCGGGNIVRQLRAGGYVAWGSDLVQRKAMNPAWWRGERDFLAERYDYPNIVFNPPYFRAKGTEACIRRALEVAEGKVCVFVDRRFMTGSGRAKGLFREHPPTRAWEITPRPSCPPGEWLEGGNEAGGGTADYAWLVWDLTTPQTGMVTGWLTDEHFSRTQDPGIVL